MSDRSHEWFLLVKGTPGEMYHLATPGRYPSTLDVAYDVLERDQALDWSGQFFGDPTVLKGIVATQEYDLGPESILPVAGGTSMGNFLACQAILKPGDEAIVESPAWTQVGNLCRRMGVDVKWWYLRPENRWRPDLDELKRMVTDRTKLIYLCNPNNPTGSVLAPEETAELCPHRRSPRHLCPFRRDIPWARMERWWAEPDYRQPLRPWHLFEQPDQGPRRVRSSLRLDRDARQGAVRTMLRHLLRLCPVQQYPLREDRGQTAGARVLSGSSGRRKARGPPEPGLLERSSTAE